MSGPSAELQKAILDHLLADAGVAGLIGDRLYDGVPADAPYPHAEFGPSDFVPERGECITSRTETLQIDVWARDAGRKRICGAVVDAMQAALDGAEPVIAAPYRIVTLEASGRTTPDPDGITWHGIVTVTAEVEAN